jgi:hypothetical protein
MYNITFVGLDVHKAAVCVAIAESGRGGEVRQSVFGNRPEILGKSAAVRQKELSTLKTSYDENTCIGAIPLP